MVRMLFVGGCHVLGSPVGSEYGFAQVAAHVLKSEFPSVDCELRVLGYVNLSSGARIMRECIEDTPDILVLQLGHYESSIPLKKRLLALIRPRNSVARLKDVSSTVLNLPPLPDIHFRDGWCRKIKSAAKLFLDSLLCSVGHAGMEYSTIELKLAELLQGVRELEIRRVFVLSPFPCVDATISRYRQQLHSLFSAEARRSQSEFVDVSLIDQVVHVTPRNDLFADDRHLSVEGHAAVGVLVAKHVARALKEEFSHWGCESRELDHASLYEKSLTIS